MLRATVAASLQTTLTCFESSEEEWEVSLVFFVCLCVRLLPGSMSAASCKYEMLCFCLTVQSADTSLVSEGFLTTFCIAARIGAVSVLSGWLHVWWQSVRKVSGVENCCTLTFFWAADWANIEAGGLWLYQYLSRMCRFQNLSLSLKGPLEGRRYMEYNNGNTYYCLNADGVLSPSFSMLPLEN